MSHDTRSSGSGVGEGHSPAVQVPGRVPQDRQHHDQRIMRGAVFDRPPGHQAAGVAAGKDQLCPAQQQEKGDDRLSSRNKKRPDRF